jgi:hypothetical protein
LHWFKKTVLKLFSLLLSAGLKHIFFFRAGPSRGWWGGANYTTTIQSTWPNLRAEHGGSFPAFAQDLPTLVERGSVIHESTQWDWLDLYQRKSKHFLIIKVEDDFPAPPGFAWVAESQVRKLARRGYLLSVDLMASIALFFASRSSSASHEVSLIRATDLTTLTQPEVPLDISEFVLSPSGRRREVSIRDGFGQRIRFVDYQSTTREKKRWIQPLLQLPGSRKIAIAAIGSDPGSWQIVRDNARHLTATDRRPSKSDEVGSFLTRRSSPEIFGKRRIKVSVSAEGGRFWRHQIHLEVREPSHDFAGLPSESNSLYNLLHLSVRSLATSLQERLAIFVFWLESDD